MFKNVPPVLIIGGDEVASAIALKLHRSQFPVVIYTEPGARYLRYHLCFGDAAQAGKRTIEEVTATSLPEEMLAETPEVPFRKRLSHAIQSVLLNRGIPLINQIEINTILATLSFSALIIAETPSHQSIGMDTAPLVIGLLPNSRPGEQCHVAVETRLNYQLGRVFTAGEELPETNSDIHLFKHPFETCQTPVEGVWTATKEIGNPIRFNEPIGKVNAIEIRSPFDGQLWGLAHSGWHLAVKEPVALIYREQTSRNYRSFGFREHAIAGGVLEAVLRFAKLSTPDKSSMQS